VALKGNIKRRREELDLTLEAVAQVVGVTRATIQKYENGIISNIPSDKIEKLADVLNVSPAYLMGWSDTVIDKDGVKYYGSRITQNEIYEDDIMNYLNYNPTAHSEQPDSKEKEQLIVNMNDGLMVTLAGKPLSTEAMELLRIFESIEVRKRMKLLEFAFKLEDDRAEKVEG